MCSAGVCVKKRRSARPPNLKAILPRRLRNAGFRLGAPPTWPAEAVAADVTAYARVQCPRCAGRRMDVKHFHRPEPGGLPPSCKIVLCCRDPECLWATEA
jgi:hypothetical protein